MEAILAKLLASKLGVAAGGALAGLALTIGFKIVKARLPGILGGWFAKEIDLVLQKGDPDDDALALAVLTWVEKKIGSGKGAEKARLAAEKLSAITGGKVPVDVTMGIVQAVFDKFRDVINSKVPRS